MRITLTRNLNKDCDYVNGMSAVVQDATHTGIRVLTKTNYILMLYPWTDEERNVYYPFRASLSASLSRETRFSSCRQHSCGHSLSEVRTSGFAASSIRHMRAAAGLAYAHNLLKVQGATIDHLTIYLDVANIEAAGYVALSRVRMDAHWQYTGDPGVHHFTPAPVC